MKKRRIALLAAVVAVGAAASADAREKFHHRWLVNSVTAERIHRHLERLQAIASRNDDTRALGTPGYKASVRYVVDRLRRAHYHPVVQEFTANLFEEHTPPVLAAADAQRGDLHARHRFHDDAVLGRGRYSLGATGRDQRHRDPADAMTRPPRAAARRAISPPTQPAVSCSSSAAPAPSSRRPRTPPPPVR